MKKQILTKQDIQRDLLAKLKKTIGFHIFLSVFLIIGIICFSMQLIHYLNGTPIGITRGIFRSLNPIVEIIVLALLIIFLGFIFSTYFVDLYKIRKGKFEILEDTVLKKGKEWWHIYRSSIAVNALSFRCGKIAVEDNVYSYSSIGDKFYVVIVNPKLKVKRNPRLVYHKKYYETNAD